MICSRSCSHRRRPTPDIWRIPRDWAGDTAFVVAGGPSVAQVDLTRLHDQHVVVVNSSYILVPWADYLVFTDLRWWREHRRRVQTLFRGQVVTLTPMSALFEGLLVLNRQRSGGLSDDPTRLAWWHTTLTTTINLLVLLGVTRIALIGVDGADVEGKAWHHDPHPARWGTNPHRYAAHGAALSSLVTPLRDQKVECFNLNPESTHRMFPFSTLDEMLA